MYHRGVPFQYFDRLSPARKVIYLRSDAIESIPLPPGPPTEAIVARLQAALKGERRKEVEDSSQSLVSNLAARLNVPPVKVKVLAVRPSGNWGELHGLYEPPEERSMALITVWMRTVARKRVVAFRTFVRTLLHELCHHLDYELYKFPETFHTEGFYKRESSLLIQVAGRPTKQADLALG
ncbi:MAG TPA: hypothetical protein VMH32_11005 [Burkholderiales bacterium]|nr:hypothetical protein [Burkholderiales bacterium]